MSFARRNESQEADFENTPFASGTFRHVARGRYTRGKRRGKLCVCKWFKPGLQAMSDEYFAKDIEAVDRAQSIVYDFNEASVVVDNIYVNAPEVWEHPRRGSTLVEPWISNYRKWNSNSGATFGGGYWDDVMQALSHFSYHRSGGQLVICDLQGGIQSQAGRHNQAVLTDPVVMSRSRRFGITDLGPDGIANFFYWHECTEFCQPHWQLPRWVSV